MKRQCTLLLAFLMLAACASEPLTVEAYGEQCHIIYEQLADPGTFTTWRDWQQHYQDILDGFEALTPPEELRAYHEAELIKHRAFRDAVHDQDPNGATHLFSIIELFLEGSAYMPPPNAAYTALPDHIKQILHDTGCQTQ